MNNKIRKTGLWVAAILATVPAFCMGDFGNAGKNLMDTGASQEGERKITCPKPDATHRYIMVPLVYAKPELGTFRLYYETNSDFDPSKKTVIFLHDGQQQPTAVGAPDEIKKKHGMDLNIVRMEHRGLPCSRVDYVFTKDGVDWQRAYEVFRWENVVEDINRIRMDLLGETGNVYLWGRSGGGILACQYLAKYSRYVDRASILVSSDNMRSSIMGQRESFFRFLEAEGAMEDYLEILRNPPVPEIQFLWIVQRLGYDYLPSEKKQIEYIRNLKTGDMSLYKAYGERYKNVEEFMEMIGKETPFSTVRIFELNFHNLDLDSPKDPTYGVFEPNSRPLRNLVENGTIPAPGIIDVRKSMSTIGTEVLLVPARWDNILPYTEMVAMNKNMPHSRLVILDDLHRNLKTDAFATRLLKAFFENGAFSPSVDRVIASDPSAVWVPHPTQHNRQKGDL